jgi:pantoate--beta-alanine ligase
MRIIQNPELMLKLARQVRLERKKIGLVPTMGALHQGHLSLIQKARQENDFTVVSIFVNPAQFGPREDFKKYPRPFKEDLRLCRKEGVDVVFSPVIAKMYPARHKTYVMVKNLSDILCGRSRPGHFTGVATIVTKLFNIVQPDRAYFGQKDAQQAIIIKRMTSDLNMPLKIRVLATVRHKDGLAMSSRNSYLNKQERKDALVLWKSLQLAKLLIKNGARDAKRIIRSMRMVLKKKKSLKIEYIAIVDSHALRPVTRVAKGDLITLAAWVGRTRLIDNLIV